MRPTEEIFLITPKSNRVKGEDLGDGTFKFNMRQIKQYPEYNGNFSDFFQWSQVENSDGKLKTLISYASFRTEIETDPNSVLGTEQHILYVYGVVLD